MTLRNRVPIAAALLAAVVLLSVAAGATAGTAPASKHADLAIQQPSYVDGEVTTTQINGSTAYVAAGEQLEIAPQNFDPENVVDFGVDTDGATLEYNADFEEFVFHSGGQTGTFEVYWVVTEPVQVEREVNNSTKTVTEMQQVRYETLLRVSGGTNVTHISTSNYEALQVNAEKGRMLNATIQDLRERGLTFAKTSGTDREIFESMVKRYVSTGDPLSALTGGYTNMWVLSFFTLGGALFTGTFFAVIVYLIYKYHKQRNRASSKQAAEGEVAERLYELDESERMQNLANKDWQDILPGDHIPHAFSEHLGANPRDGWIRLTSAILPENILADRLKIMGANGYVAIDKGDNTVDVVREADLEDAEDTETIDLAANADDLVDRINPNSDTIREFDVSTADISRDDIETEFDVMDLDDLVDRLNAQMRDFDDEEAYAEYLREFVASIRAHEYTDTDGRPNEIRHLFGALFQTGQLLDERFHFPMADMITEHLDAAIRNHDPSEKARSLITEVQRGEHS